MTARKIYRLWNSLSDTERKAFFQARKSKLPSNMSVFFKAMNKHWGGGLEKLDQKIWKTLFKSAEYNNNRLNHICNRALQTLFDYLKETRMDKELNGFLYPELLLLRELAERDLENMFTSQFRQINKTLEQEGKQGKTHFDALFELSWQETDYLNSHVARGRYPTRNVEKLFLNNDLRYLFHLVRTNAAILNFNQVLSPPTPLHRTATMFELAEDLDLEPYPGIAVLFRYIDVVSRGSDPIELDELTTFFRRVHDCLDEEIRFLAFGFLVNSFVLKLNLEDQTLYRNLLLLYIRGIRSGDFFAGGAILPGSFKNFVILANELKRFALAQGFIDAYKDRIGKEANQERTKLLIAYCQADLHFGKKEFPKAKQVLGEAFLLPKFQDSYLNLGHRILLIKVLIETKEYEQANNALHACRMYIRNTHALEKTAVQVFRTHVFYLGKVWNLYANAAGSPEAILAKLKSENPFRGMEWISEKIKRWENN